MAFFKAIWRDKKNARLPKVPSPLPVLKPGVQITDKWRKTTCSDEGESPSNVGILIGEEKMSAARAIHCQPLVGFD
jgi:hypothetical protein